MNKIFLAILFIFLSGVADCQTGYAYMRLPIKYELPSIKTNSEISSEFVEEEAWRVVVDRDKVFSYSSDSLNLVIDTLNFLDDFIVWEETDKAVRIVSKPDTGVFLNDGYFASGKDRGWVDKTNLILWPRVLSENGTVIKVLIYKNLEPAYYSDGKYSKAIDVPEKEFRLYNVLKIESKDFLLCTTDLIHNKLTRDDIFWVNSDDLNIIWDRKALVPDWDKINNGTVFRVYDTPENAIQEIRANAVDTFTTVNNYLGFLEPQDVQNNIYSASSFVNNETRTLYINNLHNDFKIAQLADYNQFLVFVEFYATVSQSLVKEELENNLLRFFEQRGISNADLNTKNVRELLEMVSGIKLTPLHADEIVRVKEMKENDFRFDYLVFASCYQKLTSEKSLEPYKFYSDILYYWLPESWIRPDLLSGIKLSARSMVVEGTVKRKTYTDFDLFYIDNSALEEEKSFEQLQAEIERCSILFQRAQTKATSDIRAGHYFFYSNSINPIIGKENATLNNILMDMRSGKPLSPIRYYDKNLVETKLLLNSIDKITGSLNIHFIVSDNFYNEELNERSLLMSELPERMKSVVAKNAAVTVYLYLYESKKNKDEMEQLIKSLIQKINTNGSNIYYILSKFN